MICYYNCGRKIIVKKNVMLVNYVMLVYYVYVRVVCICFYIKVLFDRWLKVNCLIVNNRIGLFSILR